jgi:hypothetical protein
VVKCVPQLAAHSLVPGHLLYLSGAEGSRLLLYLDYLLGGREWRRLGKSVMLDCG